MLPSQANVHMQQDDTTPKKLHLYINIRRRRNTSISYRQQIEQPVCIVDTLLDDWKHV